MPPLVDYFILLSLTDRAFALNGTGSSYRLAMFRLRWENLTNSDQLPPFPNDLYCKMRRELALH